MSRRHRENSESSWVVGEEIDGGGGGAPPSGYLLDAYWDEGDVGLDVMVATPLTPALMAISPGATPHHQAHHHCRNRKKRAMRSHWFVCTYVIRWIAANTMEQKLQFIATPCRLLLTNPTPAVVA